MKYWSYYHGYPMMGLRGLRSCYDWEVFGLRWLSAIRDWIYYNLMCYYNIRIALKADKIICVSQASKKQFLQQARRFRLIRGKE